ncbi:MAG: hypothetical protein GX444_00875 [Myxococcales bacterium]|nr:hypothetical protein [Myxococcales bacterium]
MTVTTSHSPVNNTRQSYIDMLKGLSCQMLIYGHTITMHFGDANRAERIAFTLINLAPGLFFFASGMNVVNFYDAHGQQKNFRATPFYLLSALALFVLSIAYSINRDNLYLMQIFQGVAMTTAFTYVLVRLRLPKWALAVVGIALYAFWLSRWQMMSGDLARMRGLDPSIIYDMLDPWIKSLPPAIRVLYLHFAFLPWVTFVILGAVWMRSRQQRPDRWPLWIILSVLSIFCGFVTLRMPRWRQPLLLDNVADMLYRNVPFHFLVWLGLIGLFMLAAEFHYAGAGSLRSRPLRWLGGYLELCGRESLTFFVWHWIVLIFVHAPFYYLLVVGGIRFAGLAIHATWIGTILVNMLVFPYVVRLGQRWRRRRFFTAQALMVWFFGTVLGYFALQLPRAQTFSPLAIWFSFPACLAFAFLYPRVREKLRGRFTDTPATGAAAQEN